MKYKKICKCCGKEFETNSPQKIYCSAPVHYIPCPVCGKPVEKRDRDFTRPPKCCSSKCSHELRKRHLPTRKCIICGKEFRPKSGISLICDDTHYKTCPICGKQFEVDKDHIDTKTCSKECQWKLTRQTCRENYGADYPMQTEIGQKHFHDAMEKKYGHRHALQIDKFKQKAVETQLEKYGVPYYCVSQDCTDKKVMEHNIISKTNLSFGRLLKRNNIPYRMEKRVEYKSYDFELLDRNILIEINPSFTHSIVRTIYEGVDKLYHINKTKLAKQHGYRCIHVWDWDDWNQIVDIIKPTRPIQGRKCEVVELKSKEAKDFIKQNHLQGNCYGQKLFLGLKYNGQLVQVMTFGKSRYDKKYDSELLRLCTLNRFRVLGGSSKLFKYAIDNYDLGSIISYCDLSKFSGDVYEKMGMTLIRTTPPQEIWSQKHEKVTANLLRQRGYDQLFKTNYGKGTSNDQLMLDHGWLPVYDCGQAVYGWKNEGAKDE